MPFEDGGDNALNEHNDAALGARKSIATTAHRLLCCPLVLYPLQLRFLRAWKDTVHRNAITKCDAAHMKRVACHC